MLVGIILLCLYDIDKDHSVVIVIFFFFAKIYSFIDRKRKKLRLISVRKPKEINDPRRITSSEQNVSRDLVICDHIIDNNNHVLYFIELLS